MFGQASYALLDTLRLVGGIRYSIEHKESVNFSGPTSYVGPQFPLIAPTTPDGFSRNKALATSRVNKTFRRPTYRAAIEFDAAPDVLLFANYSTGFLSGSINTAGLVTDQQQSRNYELGMKSRVGNRIQLNTSFYRTEYSNLASTFQRPNSAGGVDTLSVTGGKINATGVEAILDVIPVDNLHLTLSGNALHARYGDFPQLVSGQTNGGFAGGATRTVNLNGLQGGLFADLHRHLHRQLRLRPGRPRQDHAAGPGPLQLVLFRARQPAVQSRGLPGRLYQDRPSARLDQRGRAVRRRDLRRESGERDRQPAHPVGRRRHRAGVLGPADATMASG